MERVMLQAHRGVSSDYPENTMRAFIGAYEQGYPVIELDPAVTCDGVLVVLHDSTLNRTARTADGNPLAEPVAINAISYDEARRLDFGVWFSEAFRGEPIPLFREALAFAAGKALLIKVDNKIWNFSADDRERLFAEIEASGARVGVTCAKLAEAETVAARLSKAEIHYDGIVTEEILRALSALVPRERLAVWVPYRSPLTEWASVAFADEALCTLVKQYARLGLWIVSEYSQYEDAVTRFSPDLVETTGTVKPSRP